MLDVASPVASPFNTIATTKQRARLAQQFISAGDRAGKPTRPAYRGCSAFPARDRCGRFQAFATTPSLIWSKIDPLSGGRFRARATIDTLRGIDDDSHC